MAPQQKFAVTDSATVVNSATPPPSDDEASQAKSRATLKRANTPLNLKLLDLMAGDNAVTRHHGRSLSAAGGFVGPNANVSGALSTPTTKPPTSARAMSALKRGLDDMKSPCFFHKTFGGSINLERVLDECRAEEMTHHNLLQTATGVREVARQLGIYIQWSLLICRSYGDQDKDQECHDCDEGEGP